MQVLKMLYSFQKVRNQSYEIILNICRKNKSHILWGGFVYCTSMYVGFSALIWMKCIIFTCFGWIILVLCTSLALLIPYIHHWNIAIAVTNTPSLFIISATLALFLHKLNSAFTPKFQEQSLWGGAVRQCRKLSFRTFARMLFKLLDSRIYLNYRKWCIV